MRSALIRRLNRYKYVYLLLLPTILFFFIYRYVPMYGVIIAFKRFNASRGILGSPWVGLAHFRRMFSTPTFLMIMRNT